VPPKIPVDPNTKIFILILIKKFKVKIVNYTD